MDPLAEHNDVVLEEPTTPKLLPSFPLSASSPSHIPVTPSRSAPSMLSSAAIAGSILGSPTAHFTPVSPFMFQTPHMGMPSMPSMPLIPNQPVTLESLSSQIFSLSQCVMTLSQKVSDNQRLFEENIRLKDIVIDLEFKLKDANERVKSIDVLRDTMTSQFAELNRNLNSSRIAGANSYMGDREESVIYNREESVIYEPVLNLSYTSEPCQSDSVSPERGN